MRIAHIVLNDFTRDSRVHKFATTTGSGHDATVVALSGEGLASEEAGVGFHISRIGIFSKPTGRLAVLLRKIGLHRPWTAVVLIEFVWRVVWRFGRHDVWHCNDIEALLVGIVAKFFRRKLLLVYDCHEFEAERNAQSALKGRLIRRLERRFLPWVSEVITVSPSIAAAYKELYKVERVALIRNVPHKKSLSADPVDLHKKFNIPASARIAIYQGAFIPNRGLEQTLSAFDEIPSDTLHVVLMGYGVLQPMVEHAAASRANIHFQPAVPYDQILRHTAGADFGLLSVRPTCLSYLYCLPNKLFEYIQAGLPILSNNLPDCAEILARYKVGEVAQDGLTASAIKSFAQRLDGFPVEVFKQAQADLNWDREEEKVLALYACVEASLGSQ
jgi:glycosyltransferase involved in cell wall biosynthesis